VTERLAVHNDPVITGDPQAGFAQSAEDHGLPYRAGFVAIVGRANVGKSTLLNGLLGQKLSIVSPKPHTTRHKLLGVVNGAHFQAAFLDTPGYLSGERDTLDAAMSRQGAAALAEADVVVLVAEPRTPGEVEMRFIGQIKALGKPAILVINKTDTVAKTKLLPVISAYAEAYPFTDIVPVAALNEDGLDLLLGRIEFQLPEGEPIFAPDVLTDRSVRFMVAEAIREKLFLLYEQEVPYYVAVEVEEYLEREGDQPDYIRAVIYVDKDSQRQMLIGRDGAALKEVGVQARQEIESLVERPAYLDLWVKVNPKWRRKAGFIQRQL
jgi:GTPase